MPTVPLRIDSELVNQARSAGALFERPPTAQIEFWAKLGRVMESVLTGAGMAGVKQMARVENLDQVLALTRTEKGRQKALALIARHKGPVYAVDPGAPDVIREKLPDGTVRRGKFMNRRFVEHPRGAAREG
ncbi:MAG: ParD-like family protein [Verrucomicrobiota bacterium]|nr:ParD-like family protein [Verrucomicrobiota bacterium]